MQEAMGKALSNGENIRQTIQMNVNESIQCTKNQISQ